MTTDSLATLHSRFDAIINQAKELKDKLDVLQQREAEVQQICQTFAAGNATAVTVSSIPSGEIRVVSCLENDKNGSIAQEYAKQSAGCQKVLTACREQRLAGIVRLHVVPKDYYDRSLAARAKLLKAASVHHLCKTMIVENTQWSEQLVKEGCSDPRLVSRYFAVVLPYTTKLYGEKITRFIAKAYQQMMPSSGVGKSRFVFFVAEQNIGEQLSGYKKGAILPLGMDHPVPVIVSHLLAKLSPKQLFIGGGEVDTKLELSATELIRATNAFVADVTADREDEGYSATDALDS